MNLPECPMSLPPMPVPGEPGTPERKEPLFTTFAGALISVLILIIISMSGYWAHHITSITTGNVTAIGEIQKVNKEIATEMRGFNAQLNDLRTQVGMLGEFRPRSILPERTR